MLNQKKILITGVSSGIGLALCEYLLSTGHEVIGIARDSKKVNHLSGNPYFKFIILDLKQTTEYEKVFESEMLESRFDGFVHCAGLEETLPLNLYTNEKLNQIFQINVFSGIELLRLFSKKKISNDGASVVFIASVMSELGQPGKIGYCGSKSALLGVVKASALELAKRKIRVNAVSPGVVDTPMTKNLFSTIEQENIDRIIAMHPLGIGEVHDIIPLIDFLLSDKSRWITGQNIKIDGGYSIH